MEVFRLFLFRSINAWWLLFWAKIVNNLVHLPLFFALLNYGLWLAIALVIVWRPYNNPGQRQIFAIIESIFFTDKNHYHALDPNRNYHGTYKEDE